MRQKFHPDSGAIEFFPDPQDIAVMEVEKENKELKAKIAEIESLLLENGIVPTDKVRESLQDMPAEKLKLVCNDLGIVTKARTEDTLINRIMESHIENRKIMESIKKVKGVE